MPRCAVLHGWLVGACCLWMGGCKAVAAFGNWRASRGWDFGGPVLPCWFWERPKAGQEAQAGPVLRSAAPSGQLLAVLCCAVLCCAVLCCAVLCFVLGLGAGRPLPA